MKSINKVKQELAESHARQLNTLNQLPEDIMLTHVSADTVFFYDMTYAENMKLLHRLRKFGIPARLSHYYAFDDTIALNYKTRNDLLNFCFYCTDQLHALEKVSSGKCRIVKKELHVINNEVVCSL